MKYLISNIKFDNSLKIGDIYVTENIYDSLRGGSMTEGFEDNYKGKTVGIFNHIVYDVKTGVININNDIAGCFSLFYYFENHKLYISNNLWEIVKNLNKDEIIIDKQELKFLIFQFGASYHGNTFFKNINELGSGSELTFNLIHMSVKEKRVLDIVTTPKLTNARLAINEAIGGISRGFINMSNRNPNTTFGFGNSGGFDSRLVPIFSNELGMKIHGVTVVDNLKWRTSITEENAKKIGRHFNFPASINYFLYQGFQENLLKDISNSPLAPSQILKNGYYHTGKESYSKYISGGNGFIIGGKWNHLIEMNPKKLKDTILNYVRKIPTWNYQLGHTFSGLVSKNELDYFQSLRVDFFEDNKSKSNIDIIRNYHLQILNKHSYLGGYESQNASLPTYNIYYPYLLPLTTDWHPQLLMDRTVLKGVIAQKSSFLSKLPSQKLDHIDKRSITRLEKFIKKVRLKYLNTWGLNYSRWVRSPQFQLFAKSILERKNDMWDEIMGELVYREDLSNHPFIFIDLIKAKRIIDLVFFEEYHLLNQYHYRVNEV